MLELLVWHTIRKAMAGHLGARQVANVAYGAANSGSSKSLGPLFIALARAAERRVSDFKPQNLANTAWAFATLGQSDAPLFAALARAAERRMGDLKPQELANTAWAFARAALWDAAFFSVLARAAERRAGEFSP